MLSDERFGSELLVAEQIAAHVGSGETEKYAGAF
jgi:hypothetical protein